MGRNCCPRATKIYNFVSGTKCCGGIRASFSVNVQVRSVAQGGRVGPEGATGPLRDILPALLAPRKDNCLKARCKI